MKKLAVLLSGLGLSMAGTSVAWADYALNLTEGVTQVSREIHDLHMLIMWICVAIGVVVYGIMFYSIYHHRKSKGAVAAHFHENTTLEVVWTIIPFLILVGMAIPSTKSMIDAYDTSKADMTIKVTGYQWKWRYEYLGENIDFFSNLDRKSNEARQLGSRINPASVPNYLLDVDNPVVVPVGKKIRFLFTAADVIHSWWVPDLGWKKDAIPGFITDAWATIQKPGIYRGQCTELCGRDHGFMPIVVNAVSEDEYKAWLAQQKSASVTKQAENEKTWSKADLIAKGKEVYDLNCAACHQVNGEGIAGNFPAITGSAVATGSMADHVQMVVKGKGVMPGFGDSLSAADIAAVVTYQRNGLGNNVGDIVQPTEIKK